MDLYVIRHADAGNPDAWAGDDAARPLTPLGHRQAAALGHAFRDRGLAAEAVVTSPLARAAETAEDFRAGAAPGGPAPHTSDLLAPGELRRRKLSKSLAALGAGSVAVVGHEPDLSAYLAWLVGTAAGNVRLEKGAAALVRFGGGPAKGAGALVWVVTPDWYLSPDPAGAEAGVRAADRNGAE